jgi:ACS family D-galactonate transporter-like MFS transporter
MPTLQPSRTRYWVALMLFITVAINYLDRSNLSVAATDISRDLQLSPVRLGFIFSAFAWTYALFQIPGGWLVDRVAPRLLYGSICALWSLATVAQGLSRTFLILFGFRLLLGLFEAPTFPVCNKLVTRWFPESERARIIGFYTSGQYIGLAFLTPLLALAQSHFGWRSVFFITGGIGLAWAAIWYCCYRDPWNSRHLGEAERSHLRSGGAWVDEGSTKGAARAVSLADLRSVLVHRSLWGIYIGQFALNAVPWFFLTWFPIYLVRERHIDVLQAGYFSSLPFFAAFLGVNASGLLSDSLLRRGFSVSVARKAPVIAGMLLSTSVVAANYVTSPKWAVFFMATSFFGNGFASITWVLVSLIAPKRLVGLTGGVFNFFGNLAGILVPMLIGFVVQRGGFAPALVLVFTLTLVGVLSYAFLLGPVARIEAE